eukprot:5206197-Ditylum_brightwellii.AAC.1
MTKQIVTNVPTEHAPIGEPISDLDSSSKSSASFTSDQTVKPHAGYKKVLITGSAGFIGSHVAECLLECGDDAVIVDKMNDYYNVRVKESNLSLLLDMYGKEHISIYRGDMCDEAFMQQ